MGDPWEKIRNEGSFPTTKAERLRRRLAGLRAQREYAEKLRTHVTREVREALEEVQQTEGLTFTEAAKLLGLTRDGAYKALRNGEK